MTDIQLKEEAKGYKVYQSVLKDFLSSEQISNDKALFNTIGKELKVTTKSEGKEKPVKEEKKVKKEEPVKEPAKSEGKKTKKEEPVKESTKKTQETKTQKRVPPTKGRKREEFVEDEDDELESFKYLSLNNDSIKTSIQAKQMSTLKPTMSQVVLDFNPVGKIKVKNAFRIELPETDIIKKEVKESKSKMRTKAAKTEGLEDYVKNLLKLVNKGVKFGTPRGQGYVTVKQLKDALKGYPNLKSDVKKEGLLDLAAKIAEESDDKKLKKALRSVK